MLADNSAREQKEAERRGGVFKPTGAGKRKGQNPVKQMVGDQIPLDLSLRSSESDVQTKKVILSVPNYRKISSFQCENEFMKEEKNEVTITPVIKTEPALDKNCNEMNMGSTIMQRLLSNHPQSLLALQHFKQASLLLQEQNLPEETEMHHSLWSSLVSSSLTGEVICDDKKKIHRCDFSGCDKVYTKSSHLKAHKR